MKSITGIILALMLCIGCSDSKNKSAYTIEDGLKALQDVNGFMSKPVGSMNLISSYDRTGGNEDGNSYVGKSDDGKRVLADLKGPGCIRRIWLTGMPDETKLYFLFDGEKSPRLVKTYKELRGESDKYFVPPISAYPSGGGYCYIPMPYAKRIIVKGDDVKQGVPFFYHINYETFPKGTNVKSLTVEQLEQNKAVIEKVGRMWNESQNGEIKYDEGTVVKVTIPKNGKADIFSMQGNGIIREIDLGPDFDAIQSIVERNRLLRDIVVKIYWDGSTVPALEVPFGDLFCNGVRPVAFRSIAVTVQKGVYQIKFPMPFKTSARIEIQNDSSRDISMSANVAVSKAAGGSDYYFHAYWNQSGKSGYPHEILSVHDEGIYVGCYLLAIGMDGTWNILESDESIYRDDDSAEPSMHGTGLEDYFNGGWYYTSGPFQMPFAGALEKTGIRTAQYRWHLPDKVDFQSKIYVNIEFGHGNGSRGYMSSVAYWYGKSPSGVAVKLPSAQEREVPLDPLEPTCMMCELFARERDGKFDEARDLCREYSEKYKGTPDALAMDIRAIAYQERIKGYQAVKRLYDEKLNDPAYKDIGPQIEMLEWFHQSESNVLTTVHVNGRCAVYIDDQEVFNGDSPFDVVCLKTFLTPGRHVIAAKVDYLRPDPWFSFNMRTHYGDFFTDKTWKFSETVQDGWNKKGFDDSSWSAVHSGGPLPFMRYFQFKPNAFILSQHRAQLLGPPGSWPVGRTVYFRKSIDVKEGQLSEKKR